jgi:mRNA interferase MazF
MKPIKQFEIWIADLNPRRGTEPGKVRPVLVIQSDFLNHIHPSVIICPITTNIIGESEILRVHLKKGDAGLDAQSDIIIDQVRSIDKKRLIRKTGKVSTQVISNVKAGLKAVMDLY